MRAFALLALLVPAMVIAADWPQRGRDASRNMVADEKGLPATCEPGTIKTTERKTTIDLSEAKNIKWAAALGGTTNGSPTIGGGRIFVGTNNDAPRDPKFVGDHSMLFCLDEATGKFLWQLGVPKLSGGDKIDTTNPAGLCASAAVDAAEGRVYVSTNRGDILCLDINGQANGNDGPYVDEGQYFAGPGKPPLAVGSADADIIWRYDMRDELGVYANQQFASTVLLVGDKLYASTCNSRNWAQHVPAPNAPALICLDKRTGKLLGQEASGISKRTFFSNWSAPAYGKVGDREMVIFGGGDGYVYAFDPTPVPGPDGTPILKELWRFDANPAGRRMKDGKPIKYGSENGPREVLATPVFYQGKVYAAIGTDPESSASPGCLSCIDASKSGDITTGGKVWQYEKISTSASTPSVAGDLLFIADLAGFVYCFDANTGKVNWKHDIEGKVWGGTLVADGKVYVGNEAGGVFTFAATREKKELGMSTFEGEIHAPPIAANGVLYVTTGAYLYAITEKK
jgi:outer membrane protein assembly factor BamB